MEGNRLVAPMTKTGSVNSSNKLRRSEQRRAVWVDEDSREGHKASISSRKRIAGDDCFAWVNNWVSCFSLSPK